MIRLKDSLISLREAARKVPGRDRKDASYETIRRWATKGYRGRRLEVLWVGGRMMTTEIALQEFFQSLAAPAVAAVGSPADEASYREDRELLRSEFGI